jgi:hypothetical protein
MDNRKKKMENHKTQLSTRIRSRFAIFAFPIFTSGKKNIECGGLPVLAGASPLCGFAPRTNWR